MYANYRCVLVVVTASSLAFVQTELAPAGVTAALVVDALMAPRMSRKRAKAVQSGTVVVQEVNSVSVPMAPVATLPWTEVAVQFEMVVVQETSFVEGPMTPVVLEQWKGMESVQFAAWEKSFPDVPMTEVVSLHWVEAAVRSETVVV